MSTTARANRYGFGIGTLGRDSVYTMVSMYLIFYLSDVLKVSTGVLAAVTVVLVVARVFDAVNDPFMGVIVDNTRTRWGRFKPWILAGAITTSVFTVLLFTDFGLGDVAFVVVFAVVYLGWEITFTANDIGYWSMLPALTQDQRERERIGAFARICANIGVFAVVIAIVPVSTALAEATGELTTAYTIIAAACAVLLLVFQLVMLATTREDRSIVVTEEPTRLRDLIGLIFRNDQLLAATVALLLFTTAFAITVGFGLYYFTYIYGDVAMYTVFGAILGVAQIAALAAYPLLARRLSRRALFTAALVVVAVGYVLFLLAPPGGLAVIIAAAVLMFAGQAVIQVLMLMFIADTVEYGQWKFGRRNDSVTLSLQPFINKMGGALSSGVIGWTVIAAGLQQAGGPAGMTDGGVVIFKTAMMVIPLVLVVLSYVVYRVWYRLDETRYSQIVADLSETARARADAEVRDAEAAMLTSPRPVAVADGDEPERAP